MSSLAMNQTLLEQVLPPDQGFGVEEGYAGIFKFRLDI